MDIKIFYDGVNMDKYCDHPSVVGFTTNLSFMAQGNRNRYLEFSEESLEYAKGRPISFQVWAQDIDEMESQARVISSWGDNVYTKIPIVTAGGESTVDLIKRLHDEGLKINVTVVHSNEQLDSLVGIFNKEVPTIVSVFAGGISDAGISPEPIVEKSVSQFSEHLNVETLWAGCQRVLSILDAENCGCEIVTVPDSIMDKMNRLGKELNGVALAKSKLFREDALSVGLTYE